jgi:hypothetical protein
MYSDGATKPRHHEIGRNPPIAYACVKEPRSARAR